jgi:hypothetical protein
MTTSYSPLIVTDGLVMYLDAGNTKSYPGAGTTWTDISRTNNNGTLTNGPTFNSANLGSIVFDGVDDYVNCGNLGTIGNTQTIEVWFNSNSVTSYKNILDMNYSTYNPNTGNVGPRLEQISGTGIIWVWSGNTTNNSIYNLTSQYLISANKWYHTVFTLNSGTWNWYINGTLIDNGGSPQGYITTFGDVNIGRGFVLDPSRYYSGNIPSVKIYNKALSVSEVLQNYNATKTRYGL